MNRPYSCGRLATRLSLCVGLTVASGSSSNASNCSRPTVGALGRVDLHTASSKPWSWFAALRARTESGRAVRADARARLPFRETSERVQLYPTHARLGRRAGVSGPRAQTLARRPTRARRPAHHACSLRHRCRRRLSDTYRRHDVANRVPNGCGVDATTRPRPASFPLTARSTSRESAVASRPEPDPMRLLDADACPGKGIFGRAGCALPLVAEHRWRDHVARAVLLSGRATSGRLDRRSTSPRSRTVSAGRTEVAAGRSRLSADGSGRRRRSSCTIFSSVPT